jgi:hypothetical protein
MKLFVIISLFTFMLGNFAFAGQNADVDCEATMDSTDRTVKQTGGQDQQPLDTGSGVVRK